MNKIIVPSGKVGDIIIKAYKDAGYKIKKPKPKKEFKKVEFVFTGNGILDNIKHTYDCGSIKARQ